MSADDEPGTPDIAPHADPGGAEATATSDAMRRNPPPGYTWRF